MSDANCKIKIKFGQVEVEYEGSEGFIKIELIAILEKITEMIEKIPNHNPVVNVANNNQNLNKSLSTSVLASKLGVKNGPELVIAAAGYLAEGLGKKTFSRSEILDNIKSATTYYQKNYGKNLTHSLNSLVKDKKLLHISGENYSISEESLNSIKRILG